MPDDDDSSKSTVLIGGLIYSGSVTKTYYIQFRVSKVLYTGKTKYQRIEVVDTPDLGKVLMLDGVAQLSVNDEYVYHDNLVHPIMLTHPSPEKVLIIGGGDGGTLREVLKYKSVKKALMVEIDPGVVEVCKRYLPELSAGAFDDPRTKLIFDDGRKFVETTDEKFDIVLIDLTDPIGPAVKLFTKEFYENVKAIIKEGGGIAAQTESAYFLLKEFAIIRKTIGSVFKIVRSNFGWMPAYGMLWAFTIGSDYLDPLKVPLDVIKERYKRNKLVTRYYDPTNHHAIFAMPKNIREFLNNPHIPISTDANPVSVD